VRNYNTAVVRVVVRSSTLRERDPIMGCVPGWKSLALLAAR
jgi:hypothetical protein